MTSAGFVPPPLPATEETVIGIVVVPNILAKNRDTSVRCLTTMPFAESDPLQDIPVLVKHRRAGYPLTMATSIPEWRSGCR